MIMSNLENFQNEWNVKKIKNKWWIQNIIHYLIKWVDWFFEYNFYELMSHLTDALKTVVDYKQKLKHKCKKISQININKISDSENVSHKWALKWNHILYSIHDILNETSKSHVFHFIYFRILTDFWVNYIILHSISYFFYSQSQLIC